MSTKPDPVIRVENITKSFKTPLDKTDDVKSSLIKKVLNRGAGYRKFTALNDVSFTVNKGDFFGIVGRNGSGKSTLLKILAQIYKPDSGQVHVRGSLMPFIELGVGFNNKLTARENVYLNGAMIGFSRKEMDVMYDEIVDFAELHDFMEEKLKNFSSGMKVRLAFSIAIRAPSDILLLDEVLAVGDAAFKEKCNIFFKEQIGKRTIVLVTHDMNSVEEFCNRAMLINQSEVVKIGSSSEIASMYSDMFAREKNEKLRLQNKDLLTHEQGSVTLNSIRLTQNNKQSNIIEAGKEFEIELTVNSKKEYKDSGIGFKITNSRGLPIFAVTSKMSNSNIYIKKGTTKTVFKLDNPFTDDTYRIHVICKEKAEGVAELLYFKEDAYQFEVKGVEFYKNCLVHPKIQIKAH